MTFCTLEAGTDWLSMGETQLLSSCAAQTLEKEIVAQNSAYVQTPLGEPTLVVHDATNAQDCLRHCINGWVFPGQQRLRFVTFDKSDSKTCSCYPADAFVPEAGELCLKWTDSQV